MAGGGAGGAAPTNTGPGTVGSIAGTSGIGMGGGVLPAGTPRMSGNGEGLPMADGFGGGIMTPQATPQQLTPQMAPQQMQQRPMSPLMQQQMMRQQQMRGLQAALMQMLGQYNQPMQRQQFMPMPQYQSQALQYRPNMAQAQQALNRTATTQEEARRAAAAPQGSSISKLWGNNDDAVRREWQELEYRNAINGNTGG